jgi:glycosyltransferase involved in cell wall biosynthesis
LVRRGHDVTLCATGDSQTSAALHAVYPRGYEDDPDLWGWQFHDTAHVASVLERAGDFDVIHSHVYHFALPFARLVRTPVLHTCHVMPDDDVLAVFARYPEAQVAALSRYQRRAYRGVRDVAVVPNGIDTATFPFGPAPGDYLLFLGRLMPEKGPAEAIVVAKAVGRPLVLAGPLDEDRDYFHTRIEPLIDGRAVRYVGRVGAAERNRLLAGAAALVYPVLSPEPFGLVLAEAMACGTPVVAHGLGAVPEIVDDGVTGFIAPDLESLAARVPDAVALDRARVREVATARFDYRRMADGYEAVYRRLAALDEEGQRTEDRGQKRPALL